jgi:hypothetical protein
LTRNGAYAGCAPAGTVPFVAGRKPVLETFATLLAETWRRWAAAFIPDRAIVEMLLMGHSLADA